MTTSRFDSALSLGDEKKDKDIFARLLMNEPTKANQYLKELTSRGFNNKSFSKALLTYSEYTTDIFDKPKIFTKSYNDIKSKFTNFVDLNNNNDDLLTNLQSLIHNIVDMLPGLEIIRKDTQNDKRLKKICEYYEWDLGEEVDPENHNLFKFEVNRVKNKSNHSSNTFRVFVGVTNVATEPKKIKLLFIDPHHLAIPSRHRYTNNGPWINKNQVKDTTYSRCQYYKQHIHELIEKKLNDEE